MVIIIPAVPPAMSGTTTIDTLAMAVTNIPRTVFAVSILRKAFLISTIVLSVTVVGMNRTFVVGMEIVTVKKTMTSLSKFLL